MGKYGVPESVWLATAIMAYDLYNKTDKPTKEMMYFIQADIQKKAQELCRQNVDAARISQWCNADHNNHTHNYLRAGDGSKRRLTFPGEFDGEKEMPKLNENDLVDTINGQKSIKEITGFLSNEYADLFSDVSNKDLHNNPEWQQLLRETKCISILDYLDKYAGEPYEDPEKADPSTKEKFLEIRNIGGAAVRELDKMARICEMQFGLKKFGTSKWLNGGNNKVREYLWRQLKLPSYEECPSSISIFAEVVDGKARFRISLEINDSQSKKEDYDRHHKLLNKNIMEATDTLVYLLGGNNSDAPMEQLDLSTEEVKQRVENGEFKKIQLSRIITRNGINNIFQDDFELLHGLGSAVEALMPYYKLALDNKAGDEKNAEGKDEFGEESKSMIEIKKDKNMILYGPPGTGKTYNTVNYAVSIIENKSIEDVSIEDHTNVIERYNTYIEEGKITFTTFHQSYGYEEFIEGIKPVMYNGDESENLNITYEVIPGTFKKFCGRAIKPIVANTNSFGIKSDPVIWKISLAASGDNPVRKDCFDNNRIRIGWDEYGKDITGKTVYTDGGKEIIDRFLNQMEIGDIVFTLYDNRTIDAIGVVQGDYEWLENMEKLSNGESYSRSRRVKWILKNIKEDILSLNGGRFLSQGSVYRLNRIQLSDVINILEKYKINTEADLKENKDNYVFIIDEINRGNISKIFGELITLIETTKRLGEAEGTSAKLPYSNEPFGVPSNVYIIGTMNTADRSIALMDTALRRRFKFVEMMPDSNILSGIKIGNIDIMRVLDTINKRIEFLYDREHTIGHAYFISLKNEPTVNNLASIFRNSIIPLMQEYFYEDYNKIQFVLGDNVKSEEYKFIKDEVLKVREVFKGNPDIDLPERKYSIQTDAFYKEESYIQIYE